MTVAERLLPQFDHELSTTRRVLERVPDAQAAWTPHVKSMNLGRLASHIGTLPRLGRRVIDVDVFDVLGPDGSGFTPPSFVSTAALLTSFDEHVRLTRVAIAGASDDHLLATWTLTVGGVPQFTLPRIAVLRSFLLSHLIHHRGQLTVYLRMRDVALPSIYGPSADEQP